MTDKFCKTCNLTKPASEFHGKSASKDGLSYSCAKCECAKKAASTARNREHANFMQRKRRAEKREEYLARDRAWRAANPERRRAAQKRYEENNPGRKRELTKQWWHANRERVRAKERRHTKELSDGYVNHVLTQNTNLSAKEIPAELRELKRLNLKMERELK